MTPDRRALLAGLGSLLALAGCHSGPAAESADVQTDEVQNAVNMMADAVESLNRSVNEFGTANWTEIVPHVRAAAGEVKQSLTALRAALGYPEQ